MPESLSPRNGRLAIANVWWPRDYKTAPLREPIPVQVRLLWIPLGLWKEDAIVEWCDGDAIYWTQEAVGVRIDDPRSYWSVPWVKAADVRRR